MTNQKNAQDNLWVFFIIAIVIAITASSFQFPASRLKTESGCCLRGDSYFFLFSNTCGDADSSSLQDEICGDMSPITIQASSNTFFKTAGSLPPSPSSESCRSEINSDKLQVRRCESEYLSLSDLSLFTDYIPQSELVVIMDAAKRNDCLDDNLLILLAIRKAENGRAGREFGVMAAKAIDTNLKTQAAWAAATIVKNRSRWQKEVITARKGGDKQNGPAPTAGEFITFLGRRYCPPTAHRINRYWEGNVNYWYGKFKSIATESAEDTEIKLIAKNN